MKLKDLKVVLSTCSISFISSIVLCFMYPERITLLFGMVLSMVLSMWFGMYLGRQESNRELAPLLDGKIITIAELPDDEYCFTTRDAAEDALSSLLGIIDLYGEATLADLKDIIGLPSIYYIDTTTIWTDLKDAHVRMYKKGYRLEMNRKTEVSCQTIEN